MSMGTQENEAVLDIVALEEGYLPTNLDVGWQPDDSERSRQLLVRLRDIESYRLPTMDEAGVTLQVLSVGFPGVNAERSPARAVALAKGANDDMAAVIQRHPTRFSAFAVLPFQDPAAAADELERSVRELSFRGALTNGHTNGEYLDDEKFFPVWERAEALNVPIYIHPAWPATAPACLAGYEVLQGAAWGWAFETGSHALRLIVSGLFDRFPGLTVILGHMGEGIPFTLDRLDNRWATYPDKPPLKKQPSDYFRENFYITTAGANSATPLECAISAIGTERIMFSIDYPHEESVPATEFLRTVPLAAQDRRAIAAGNARRLLDLP